MSEVSIWKNRRLENLKRESRFVHALPIRTPERIAMIPSVTSRRPRVLIVDLNDDGIAGGEMQTLTTGVTGMWNPNTRVKLNVVYADVEGGSQGDGSILYVVTRFQVDF